MGTSSIVFNGNNFVDNLKLILAKNISDVNTNTTTLSSLTYVNDFNPNGFFGPITTSNAPFTNWTNFQRSWNNFNGLPSTDVDLTNAFIVDFKSAIGYPADFPNGTNVTDSDVATWFNNSMSIFLRDYPYKQDGSVGNAEDFFGNWVKYMAGVANVQSNTTVPVGAASVSMANYFTVYEAFFPQQPNETPTDVQNRFAAELQSFISSQVSGNGSGNAANGWFVPSQSFHDWFTQQLRKFNANQTKTIVELQTTVDTNGSASSLLVISRVLALLTKMVSILQQISAAQAQQLSFQTTWQSNYTTMLTQVPQFAQGDNTPLGGSTNNRTVDKRAAAFRNKDTNPKMQNILQQVQARQSNVQDTAKSLQTNINQSQDAANQLTQMLTSFLQNLNSILGSIYR